MSIKKPSGRVLVVAGSDSGGGAGIQGDIKTITMLGGYAATAITALTAQNSQGVFGIHEVPTAFLEQQMRLVLEDIGADCIKTGMLHSAGVISTVAKVLADYPDIPLVLDPVMVAKGGAPLLQQQALEALRTGLIPRAVLITPNVPEAELLAQGIGLSGNQVIRESGYRGIGDSGDMVSVGKALLVMGTQAVLMKGGHLPGDEVKDILITRSPDNPITHFTSPRIHTKHTHGTGCTLASAIATGLAQGMELAKAVERARGYVHEAIRTAPGFGRGHGPLNHSIK